METISTNVSAKTVANIKKQRFSKSRKEESDSSFTMSEYISKDRFEKIKERFKDKPTPYLIIDIDKIKEKYRELIYNFPFVDIYYAVKANPDDRIIAFLAEEGAYFDIASVYELDQVLSHNVSPERISYGNTIKKESAIKYAYDKGIRMFATDSETDILKISKNAPGSNVYFRLLCDGSGADWPLSRKFGAHADMVFNLAMMSKELGLIPYGLSFHVGSQQRDIGKWDDVIGQCKYLFDALKKEGIELEMINMGGGLPGNYKYPTLSIKDYASEIKRFLQEDFPNLPRIIIEPGRSLVADSGILVSEIVLISQKTDIALYRWIYVDIGKFSGLIETIDESIKYPIYVEKEGDTSEVILAGPTCDSLDILYENHKYELPETLEEGDKIYFFTTGAYTKSYSSISFNGFPPLDSYIYEDDFENN